MNFKVLKKIANVLKAAIPAAALIVYCIHTEGCANTSRGPSGGPKDTIPPVIVGRIPDTVLTKFPIVKGKILITFNEYVQLKDANNEVVVSPPLKKKPTVKIKKKSVLIAFPDTLLANRTYSINFGNSIQDVNEGNTFPNYVYTFSTGNSLDSLIYSGTVMDYETLLPVKGISVSAYIAPRDSSVMKDLPDAITRTDEWGYFCFRALKGVPYSVYAFEDANHNNLYDPGSEHVGFCDSTVTPQLAARKGMPQIAQMRAKDTLGCLSRPSAMDIYLFKEKSNVQYISNSGRTAERAAFIKFNSPYAQIDSFTVKGIHNDKLIKQFNTTRDSMCFWINEGRKLPDTLTLRINYYKTDTLGKLRPAGETIKLVAPKEKKQDNKNKQQTIQDKLNQRNNKNSKSAYGRNVNSRPDKDKSTANSENEKKKRKDLLDMKLDVKPETVENDGFSFTFPAPLVQNDFNKIRFTCTTPRRITTNVKFTFSRDSANILHYKLQSDEPYKVGNDYVITVPKGIFKDINGFTNDSTGKKISLPTDDRLSSISLEIRNTKHGCKYLVELVSEKRDKVYLKYSISDTCTLLFPYLQPGNYSFRLTEDKNGNGILDTGSILEKREPEKARLFKLPDGKAIIKLKERTDLTQEIDIAKIFEH